MPISFLAAVLAAVTVTHSPAPIAIGGPPADTGRVTAANGDILGLVTDSATGAPLAGTEITITAGAEIVATAITDRLGRYRVHDLTPGAYEVEARFVGFSPLRAHATVDASGNSITVNFRMVAAQIQLTALEAQAAPITLNTRTGEQVYHLDQAQNSPAMVTSQIVQQAIAGAARAPTGEVHIRGQHAEYSYYVDGIPVPAGISGSLNELFDPTIADNITFQTGSWDAEYGGKNAAIINVQTRIPAGGFHGSLTGFGGDYGANGQGLTASGNSGRLGLFVAATRSVTDLRREPVVADTNAGGQITGIRNYANHGEDLYSFAKLAYSATDHDVFNFDVNWSRTTVQTPFDSSAGVIDDRERDGNAFVNAGYTHRVTSGDREGSELFAGGFYRHGSLNYTPGAVDDPSFTFAPDTTLYNIREARSFDIYGAKIDYLLSMQEHLSFKFGTLVSAVRGNEDFTSFDANQNPGPASNSTLNGHDLGFYAQTMYLPSERWELRLGARYDVHSYPLSPTQDTSEHQLSPRIRLSFFPSPQSTLWVYYGRQFLPVNTEDLRNITSAAEGGVVSAPTRAERDDFFEAGLTHRFEGGVVLKLSGYHKRSAPGVDDTQVPGTAITTDVNIDQVRITGVEAALEIRPKGPLSGFLNLAINHAYGFGAITGGFFETVPPAQTFDLDHDQRVSSVIGLTFNQGPVLVNATGIYGSGLTNGVTPNTPGVAGYDSTIAATGPSGTGLFDFNKEFKVKPSFIVNLSAGYTIIAGGTVIRPQVFVNNLFDTKYSLKGTFFSGANFGLPRTIQVRLSVGI